MRVHFSTKRAAAPVWPNDAHARSIPDWTYFARRVFALAQYLMAPWRNRDRRMLLVPQPRAFHADGKIEVAARLLAKHRGFGQGKGVSKTGQLALRNDDPVPLPRHRYGLCRDRLDGAHKHIPLPALLPHRPSPFHVATGLISCKSMSISSGRTSFNEARISQSGLRRANSAAKAQRSMPCFLLKASAP